MIGGSPAKWRPLTKADFPVSYHIKKKERGKDASQTSSASDDNHLNNFSWLAISKLEKYKGHGEHGVHTVPVYFLVVRRNATASRRKVARISIGS